MLKSFEHWLDRQRDAFGLSEDAWPMERPEGVDGALEALGGLGVVGRYIEHLESAVRNARAAMISLNEGHKDSGPWGSVYFFASQLIRDESEWDDEDRPLRAWAAGSAHAANIQQEAEKAEAAIDRLFDALALRETAAHRKDG